MTKFQTSKNRLWDKRKPDVTVITPFFNRSSVLRRCMNSVAAQTYKNFEYIIVDDGSVENNDEMIYSFMDQAGIAVLYIKKKNGGVHTARNAGIRYARGKYTVFLDSDDELLPDALQVLIQAWEKIPAYERNRYFEIKARCIDQNGTQLGERFPDGINELPYEKAVKIYEKIQAEHIGIRRTRILQANPWPEPDGITFVQENIIWYRLRRKYKSFFINEIVRVYHTETEHSIVNNHRYSIQHCKNTLWGCEYMLNHWKLYHTMNSYFKLVMLRNVLRRILEWKNEQVHSELLGKAAHLMAGLFYVPSVPMAIIYSRIRL